MLNAWINCELGSVRSIPTTYPLMLSTVPGTIGVISLATAGNAVPRKCASSEPTSSIAVGVCLRLWSSSASFFDIIPCVIFVFSTCRATQAPWVPGSQVVLVYRSWNLEFYPFFWFLSTYLSIFQIFFSWIYFLSICAKYVVPITQNVLCELVPTNLYFLVLN